MTFADDLLEAAGDEPIVQVVIGAGRVAGDARHAPGLARQGELLTWDQARPLLDYDHDYNIGWQVADCQAVYAWTPTRVLFVVKYDDDTQISAAPRDPTAVVPVMFGV